VTENPKPSLRERLRRIFLGLVALLVGGAILTFGVDFAVFRIRVAANRDPYGSVTVKRYYAVLQKNGRTQFIFEPPEDESCVNALYPHSGQMPCWYLSRHPEQRTEI
jgi:hypothetical protein